MCCWILTICGSSAAGNVMCSRGSVIPLWIEQIKAGNPITITEPSMTRFIMSLDEAVDLVVQGAPHLEKEIRLAVKELFLQVESYPYATEWVRSLKEKGYRVYILSNYGEIPFAASKARMPFLPYVDGQVISYEVREVKPSAAIYQALCDKYHIDPDKAVFIDDSPVNVAGAKAFGLHTILFTDYANAIAQLETYGVKGNF